MLSRGPSPEWYWRIVANASARLRNVAETSPGKGRACSLEVLVVSTCSRVEKKVERSGRRGGWEVSLGLVSGTLCSTEEVEFSMILVKRRLGE